MKWLLLIPLIYVGICVLLYFVQERLIFFPEKTPKDAKYRFNGPFEEMFFTTNDAVHIHGILFKTQAPKGLIFYLHGNAGSIESWGDVAELYNQLGYDLFMIDYRGYGKSDGSITSERDIYNDVQLVFSAVTEKYPSSKIIVLGYSLGTGPAAKLAAENKVNMLVLQSPYYSMTDVMLRLYKVIPPVVLRYKLESYKYVKACKAPIVIFHGEGDELISIKSAKRLQQHLKPGDVFITIEGLGQNGMSGHPEYIRGLQHALKRLQ